TSRAASRIAPPGCTGRILWLLLIRPVQPGGAILLAAQVGSTTTIRSGVCNHKSEIISSFNEIEFRFILVVCQKLQSRRRALHPGAVSPGAIDAHFSSARPAAGPSVFAFVVSAACGLR